MPEPSLLALCVRADSGCPCFKSKVAAVQGLKKRFHLALPEPQVRAQCCRHTGACPRQEQGPAVALLGAQRRCQHASRSVLERQ